VKPIGDSQCELGIRSALVDTCVFRIAEFARSVLKEERVESRGITSYVKILGHRRTGPYDENKEAAIRALPTIARLSREGRLRLFRSSEIEGEDFSGRLLGGTTVDLFAEAQFSWAHDPIQRWRFQQCAEFHTKALRTRFCEWLLSLTPEEVGRLKSMPKLSDFEIKGLESVHRFREICRHLPEKHYVDALHLWTAEMNGMDFFLTTDAKFIRAIKHSSAKLTILSEPISPTDVLNRLGIASLDPLPISDHDFHYLFGDAKR
jgi:hypothetical protein